MNSIFKIIFISFMLLTSSKSFAEIKNIEIHHSVLNLYVAKTEAELKTGLSDFVSIGENEGMLFIFPFEDKHCMTMKNMKFPIDIIFINDNMHIETMLQGMPQNKNLLCSRFKVKYAIELKAGWIKRNQIFKGYSVGGIQ